MTVILLPPIDPRTFAAILYVTSCDGPILFSKSALHTHLVREIPSDGYDHASFITVLPTLKTSFKCELCDTVLEDGMARIRHCDSLGHKKRVNKIRQMRGQPFAVHCSIVQLRIDALGLDSWKERIQGLLYWFLLYQSDPGSGRTMDYVVRRLETFEHMERTSLLELAVWKAMCIASADSAAMKDHHSWLKWLTDGWKSQKCTMRRAGKEIAIILTHVVPFLMGPKFQNVRRIIRPLRLG